MSKKSSTGSLAKADHEKQEKLYQQNYQYDYLIIGTGSAALAAGALLANKGYKICMLEAHDIPGGYAHSFKTGDFYFCAQIHYTWGCDEGGTVYEYLKKIGLEKDITFEKYDSEGYDHMVLPDGKTVKIPYGYDKLAKNIDEAFPGQEANILKFTSILDEIDQEIRTFPQRKIKWWEFITRAYEFRYLIKYRNKTLQQLFDECNISKEAQAVLSANAGDLMVPPDELSIFAYVGLFGGYNKGAYYPTKHFKYYTERMSQFITGHEGCHIYYETPVTKINIENGKVTSVETKDGKKFMAQNYICNMDPQKAAKDLIGIEKFPSQDQELLNYEYSPSGMMMYLGLKDIDLKKYGFGKHNTWHLTQWDMNKNWKEQLVGNFENMWVFMSTPTLHSKAPGVAPAGCEILEIATLTDYQSFKDAQNISYANYAKKKMELAEKLLDFVEKNYIPDLRKHIVVKTVGTPTTNEDFVMAPQGNAYGSMLTPKYMGLKRLKAQTPWPNFYWCNASSGYPGFYGTINTGVHLYMDLTKDNFLDESKK